MIFFFLAVRVFKIKAIVTLFAVLLLASTAAAGESIAADLVAAALERTRHQITYDGSYYSIKYPGGDVPSGIGVCTDVIIRSYRRLGVDLQQLVHEDMKRNFAKYPSQRVWGLNRPDANIDHRRVLNLQVFFKRKGRTLPVTNQAKNYRPGDIVTWMLPGNLPHIGIVTNRYSKSTGNPMIVHNIGQGPKLEDMLLDYPITGHFRYQP